MSTCRSRLTIALLGGIASALLLTAPSRARELCGGDLDGLPNELLDLYLERLAEDPGVGLEDEEFCAKLTQNFVKGCRSAVKDSIKCELAQVSGLDTQNREGCKVFVARNEAGDCSASFKTTAKSASTELKDQRAELDLECTNLAGAYSDACMFGF